MAPRPHRFELAVLGVAVALLFVGILVVRSSASVGTAAAESPAQKASVLRSSVPRRPGGAARRTPGQLQPPQAGSAGWVTSTEPISVGGMDRSYLLVEPAPLPRTPVPVIVVLHGLAASPQFEEARTDFMPIVGPAVLVYPFGYQMSWNAGTCCGAAKDAGVNDVAFISGVVDKVLSDHPTSTEASQVFLVGYSNGGKMAWQMACQDPSQFAAIGVFGAVPAANCPTRQPVAAIELAGSSDPEINLDSTVPPVVQYGYQELSVADLAAAARSANGCVADSTSVTIGTETTTTWAQCSSGLPVAVTIYDHQNHAWPGPTSSTPSAQEAMWAFFESVGAR